MGERKNELGVFPTAWAVSVNPYAVIATYCLMTWLLYLQSQLSTVKIKDIKSCSKAALSMGLYCFIRLRETCPFLSWTIYLYENYSCTSLQWLHISSNKCGLSTCLRSINSLPVTISTTGLKGTVPGLKKPLKAQCGQWHIMLHILFHMAKWVVKYQSCSLIITAMMSGVSL